MKDDEGLPQHIAGDLYGPVDGWFLFYRPTWIAALLRFAERQDGRLVVGEVYVSLEDGVTSEVLRTIPIGRAEATANAPDTKERIVEACKDQWIIEGLEPSAPRQVPTWLYLRLSELDASSRAPIRPRLKLRIPPRPGKRADEFYRRVAEAYGWLATRSKRPAAELAEANSVPVTTVHRWVKEARHRGFLGPGRRGGAG